MTLLVRLIVAGTIGLAVVALIGTDWSSIRLVELPQIYDRIPTFIRGLPGSGVQPEQELFHPREVGGTLAVVLPIAVVWLMLRKSRADVLLSLSAIISGGLILLLSQALMGYFGFVVAFVLIAIWWRRWLMIPPIIGLASLVPLVMAYGPQRLAASLLDMDHTLGPPMVLRFDMWSRAWAMIQDFPYTGIGLNTYPLVQSHFYIGHIIGPEVHTHNLFLQIALDIGIPGLIAFLALLAAFIFTLIKAYKIADNRELRVLLVGFSVSVAAYVSGGLLDVVTIGAKPIVLLWMILGLTAAVYNTSISNADAGRSIPGVRAKRLFLFAIPIIILLFLTLAFPSSWQKNLALTEAQKNIYRARETGTAPLALMEKSVRRLNRAVQSNPDPELYAVLGATYAWLGDHERAVQIFSQRIEIDKVDPLESYAPIEAWRDRLAGKPVLAGYEGLRSVYKPWKNRFPNRADGYIMSSLVLVAGEGNIRQALGILQEGLEAGAEPTDSLIYLMERLRGE